MTTYLVWIGVIYFLLILAMRSSRLEYVYGVDQEQYLPNKFFVFFIFVVLSGLYIFRWCNGTDFFNYYMDFYSSRNDNFSYVLEQRDILFSFVTYITKNYISDNFLIYNAILAICTYVPIIAVMRKYSSDFKITMLLYIFSTAYFKPYNTVRQGIAVSIMFYAFPFLIERRYKKFLFYTLVASLFHPTAAITAIIMFFCLGDFLSKQVKIFLAVFAASGIGLKSIWNSVIGMLDSIGQTKMASDYADALTGITGINIFHVLVVAVPVILCLVYKNVLLYLEDEIEYEFISFYMNSLLFFLGFVLIGMYNPIFARMGQFFELYLLLLYPRLIEKIGAEKKRTLAFFVLTAYFVYFLVVLPRGGSYVPYQFNHYSIEGIVMQP